MAPRARVVEAGDAGLQLVCGETLDPVTNARAVHVAQQIRAMALRGVRDVVPTFRSVAVYLDPLQADVDDIVATLLREVTADPPRHQRGALHDIPVVYGGEAGPDLDAVAATSGLSAQQVIAAHSACVFRVFMLGFLPGFAYMGVLPDVLVARRRSTPRPRVPAGSVGVAGQQTGIYPRESPGGWALIGRTSVRLFDTHRPRPSLLAPGDQVRFIPSSGEVLPPEPVVAVQPGRARREPALVVERPGLQTTVQDLGRWGHASEGVGVAGAMDGVSLRRANAAVGNRASDAALEITVTGPELRVTRDVVMAIAGAEIDVRVDGVPAAAATPLAVRSGARISAGPCRTGARAYLALAGGVDVPEVLGSRSTHLPSEMGGYGGRGLRAGDTIATGEPQTGRAATSVEAWPAGAPWGERGGGRTLRVMPGPQHESFPPGALQRLLDTTFVVSPQSNRMGYRLTGGQLPVPSGEMISDATFAGSVQVPPSGEPILLMADRQTTGGYPQLAVVITADLPRAAQLAPGDRVRFAQTTRRDAVAALAEQEQQLRAMESHVSPG